MKRSRKVIFVGGSAYSGSTYLDMMLANSPEGFSCGEVNALFFPYRSHHLDPQCGCNNANCGLWKTLRAVDPDRLYEKIFDLLPKVRFIVDSSKDPLWIYDRSRHLKKLGVCVENVLIWKTLKEYYQSCAKRGEDAGWKRRWANYHRFYFSMVSDWFAVKYTDVATSDDILSLLCDRIAIPYFEGKRNYWEKEHHILFGNTSAKIHLYSEETDRYKLYKEERDARLNTWATSNGILDRAKALFEGERYLNRIERVLRANSLGRVDPVNGQGRYMALGNNGEEISSLKFSGAYEGYRRLRRGATFVLPRFWLGNGGQRRL